MRQRQGVDPCLLLPNYPLPSPEHPAPGCGLIVCEIRAMEIDDCMSLSSTQHTTNANSKFIPPTHKDTKQPALAGSDLHLALSEAPRTVRAAS